MTRQAGRSQGAAFCEGCGAELPGREDQFCTMCGQPVATAARGAAHLPHSTPAEADGPGTNTPTAPDGGSSDTVPVATLQCLPAPVRDREPRKYVHRCGGCHSAAQDRGPVLRAYCERYLLPRLFERFRVVGRPRGGADRDDRIDLRVFVPTNERGWRSTVDIMLDCTGRTLNVHVASFIWHRWRRLLLPLRFLEVLWGIPVGLAAGRWLIRSGEDIMDERIGPVEKSGSPEEIILAYAVYLMLPVLAWVCLACLPSMARWWVRRSMGEERAEGEEGRRGPSSPAAIAGKSALQGVFECVDKAFTEARVTGVTTKWD